MAAQRAAKPAVREDQPFGDDMPQDRPGVRPLIVGGILLGAGLGGFLDGILLHQVLQWHQMFTSHPDPGVANDRTLNITADGWFHVATWMLTVAGIVVILGAMRRPDARPTLRNVGGAALVGAGLFNLTEGIVDHHVLGIHHVHPSGALVWDLAFLVLGALLVVAGWLVLRSGTSHPVRRGRRSPRGSRL